MPVLIFYAALFAIAYVIYLLLKNPKTAWIAKVAIGGFALLLLITYCQHGPSRSNCTSSRYIGCD